MSDSKASTVRKPTSAVVKGYLVLYNAVLFVAWAVVLALVARSIAANAGNYEGAYSASREALQIAQTAALMEVLHALLGLVQSPVLTTAIQLLSRLYLVWGILAIFPEVGSHLAFASMTFAWSVTEVIRYSYYALNLCGWTPGLLLWCRYNFFLILYPLGAFSECTLVYQSLSSSDKDPYYYVRFASLSTYLPGLYTMYTYMLYQRKKYMRKNMEDKKEQ